VASEEDFPDWGPAEQRGVAMEISTAAAALAAGANAVILRHPVSVATVSAFVSELM
jgi:acetyl-CoA decarbonylase/synthase complex subunit delta